MCVPNNPPRPFSQADVTSLNAGQIGVYAIYNKDRWIYVGSGDIKERMLGWVRGENPDIIGQRPTAWQAGVTRNYVEREKQLIRELNPVCNKRVG